MGWAGLVSVIVIQPECIQLTWLCSTSLPDIHTAARSHGDPGILMGSPVCQIFTLQHGARTHGGPRDINGISRLPDIHTAARSADTWWEHQSARYSHWSTEHRHMVDPGILMGSPDCQVFTLPHGARTQEWRTCDQEPLPVLNATAAQRIGHGKDSLVISFLEYQFFDCLCPVQFHTPHQLSTSQLGNPKRLSEYIKNAELILKNNCYASFLVPLTA